MSRPTIAILCNAVGYANADTAPPGGEGWAYQHSIGAHYVDAVAECGGIPLLVPCLAEPDHILPLLEACDGLLITGGADVAPADYHALPSPNLKLVNPFRDAFDRIAVQFALSNPDLPVLGICRGIQSFNVYAGGTLIQDIPTEVDGAIQHNQHAPAWHPSHWVTVDPDCRLAEIWGAGQVMVNSFHHQAIKDLAPGLRAVAHAPDGVIEAAEAESAAWRILVQCHPEHMFRRHSHMRRLFEAFIQACG